MTAQTGKILSTINDPTDLKKLKEKQLPELMPGDQGIYPG